MVRMTALNTFWQVALTFSSSFNVILPGEGRTWKMLPHIVHFHKYAPAIDKSPGTQHVKGVLSLSRMQKTTFSFCDLLKLHLFFDRGWN